ncbi:MAG: PRC-barrel domain-containing protein [Acidimicrobiia bacterium]
MTFDDNPEHTKAQSAGLVGHPVIDRHLEPVGTISYVLYDERDLQPRWAVVKLGVLRGEHFVPLAESYVDHDGRLVVPYDKTIIKYAPRPRRAQMLDNRATRQLRDYYGVAA